MFDFLVYFGLPLLALVSAISVYAVVRQNRAPLAAAGDAAGTFEIVAFESTAVTDREYFHRFLDQYFAALADYVSRAEKSIHVLDYLAHHRSLSAKDNKELVAKYEAYFRLIEKLVHEKGLRYRRTLQLPLPRIEDRREERIAECLSLMFVETFDHIKRMLSSDADFKLYSLETAVRPYSYMVIDGEYILTEYDRYNAQGVSIADHLIINCARSPDGSINSKVGRLIRTHEEWIARLLKGDQPITLSEFERLASSIGRKELREMEVRLALREEDFRKILAGSKIEEDMVRDVRFYGHEDVRKNVLGIKKKLQLIKSTTDSQSADNAIA